MIRFFEELKRRHVFRVAVTYAATAFVILQVADLVVEPLRLPDWTMPLLIVLLGAGFPIALVLAWAFDLTPDGIKRTPARPRADDADGTEADRPSGRRRPGLAPVAVGLFVVVSGWWAFDAYFDGGGMPSEPVIGVAPFRNSTGIADLDWHREAIARLVLDNLAQSRYLQVVTAERMQRLARRQDRLPLRAGEAGIDLVVTGEILGSADDLSVAARLLGTREGNQLNATRVTNLDDDDLLSAAEDVALAVRREMQVPLMESADSYIADFAVSNPAAYEQYIRGLHAFNGYRYEEAASRFTDALDLAPGFTMARYRLAHVTAALGRTDEARSLIQRAMEERDALSPRDALYVEAGAALIDRRNQDAIGIYREILQHHPYETEARRHLAELYERLQQPEKAVAIARELERLAPEAPTTWSLLGRNQLSTGDYASAVTSLQRYVELAPQEANAHQLLGDSYRARGELDRAMAEYREALALDPDFHFATVSLATTLVLRGRLEEAADLLSPLASRVGVIPRHRIDAGFALAHVRRAQGRFNDAAIVLGALEPALKDEGVREAMGLSVRGLSLMAIGESESAASLIEKAIDRSPGVPTRYLFARGLLELSRGDTAAARVTAAAIAEHALPPENPDRTEDKAAAYLRGRAMLRQGDAEGAIRALSRAVELSGYRYRIYRRDLARALLEAGRVEEAATAAREAAESVDLADPRIDLELERRRARLVLAEAERALGRTRSAASRVNDLLSAWSGADEGFAARARAQDMAEQLGDAGRSMAQ